VFGSGEIREREKLGREKLKRNVYLLLFGLKRDRKERNLKRGTHMFFISPQRCEERAEK
jgi:hypothetical protein